MTRLIITGRNRDFPANAAQSMAHLMPTKWPSFDDRIRQAMARDEFDTADDAIEALVWGYNSKETSNANQ